MGAAEDDPELRPRRILVGALLALLAIALAVGSAFGLLHMWRLPAGDEGGSAALISPIPEPRLQTAPQLDRRDTPNFEQRHGVRMPLGLELLDSRGMPVNWQALARDGKPLVLLPAYYRCDTLCGTVAHGALEALADTGLPPNAWHLLLFSIDPRDTPVEANSLRSVYMQYARFARPAVYAGSMPDIRLLIGRGADTTALARSMGLRWQTETASNGAAPSFAHATGLVVLTPDGVVSRYLFGVRFDPPALRAALVEASQGRVGTLADRLLLACSHFDSRLGTYDAVVMAAVRVIALLVLSALAAWIWQHRRSARSKDAR
jgi:protein SCO1/2